MNENMRRLYAWRKLQRGPQTVDSFLNEMDGAMNEL